MIVKLTALGLGLDIIGAIILASTLLKSDEEILFISSYTNSGAVLDQGHVVQTNSDLKEDLENSRERGILGTIILVIGFSFQLISLFY